MQMKVEIFLCVLSKSESVKFSLSESVICLFTDSSVKKYFPLLNQLIFPEIINEIWLIYSNLFLAIWISQISLIIVLLLWQSRTWQIFRLLEWVAFDDVAVDLCGSSCSDELFCLAALYSVKSCSTNWNKNTFRCICIPVISL